MIIGEQEQVYKDLLFLDFDGVLNSNEWVWTHPENRGDRFIHIDPSRVEIMNRLVDKLNCHVVISSAWRILFNLSDLRGGLRGKGATFWNRIVAKTDSKMGIRGDQIARFANRYPDARIVIIDDSTDMGHLMPFLVRTNADTGIVEADIDRAVAVIAAQ